MHIVIACGAMSFGPHTPDIKSLGGSETAALELSKALGAKGHDVHLFCNLPPEGAPDFVPSGHQEAGVVYHHVSEYGRYVNTVEHDLTIGVRDPQFMIFDCKSKKKVLWAHDIFTKTGMARALDQFGWCFDEIWCVSEWHRAQVNEATGYPLENIVALRNGIVKHADILTGEVSGLRGQRNLIYASRPERGLDNLIRPGGVMDNLPEYTLYVAMYEHFPEHMRGYYEQIFARMKAMPNVEFIGGKSNRELRNLIAQSAAYIYPTQFEETSCILARECIEQRTPFLTTSVGALPETLQSCGIYFEDWLHANGLNEPDRNTIDWCKLFAIFFRETMQRQDVISKSLAAMEERSDLYWDGVADMVEAHAAPAGPVTQTCGAAIIAMNNEDTILRCLNSLVGNVDVVQIALGPSTDHTREIIAQFESAHPDIAVFVKDVPKIEARVFGFDHARTASVEGLKTDWILWIDTDEYLVGNLRKYLRNNYLQSYLISQHHFTVEPRGTPTQIDRPARLFRRSAGFVCRGHIHEHFEVAEGGPGRCYYVQDVDIGHTGYQNETIRQERFGRNWPFLEWEHEEPNQRKLNHFLWLRDIIHRMRWAAKGGKPHEAIKLAHEAEAYYNAHWEDMSAFGPGVFQSLAYLSEAYQLLGKGVPLKIGLQLNDRNTVLEGTFESYTQVERILRQMLGPEFKDRQSRYY